jgi:three-Cys-motif partner protein
MQRLRLNSILVYTAITDQIEFPSDELPLSPSHQMSQSKRHFEEFQPHSKHKHLILQQYFLAWGHKLGLRPGAGTVILYVDACAGRGRDDLGNHGSPLIAAVAAAVAQENVCSRRTTPFQIHVVGIEANRAHYEALARLLSPFGNTVTVLHGTLQERIVELEGQFPNTPTLTFIDPFGLDPLRSEVVRRALSGEKNEALLLFADQAALRHFGAITAEETRAERRHRKAAMPLPLFPTITADGIEDLESAAVESREALDITRESALRIMNAAFGDEKWLAHIEQAPQNLRRRALIDLYFARLRTWGANYTLHVPIVDSSSIHAYTLIHASKSPKAYVAMKEAVSYALEHSPLPRNVVENMRERVSSDLDSVESAVRRQFVGARIRWTENKQDRQASCVRRFILEKTEAYPFELDKIKARLRPLKLPSRSIIYSFPPE